MRAPLPNPFAAGRTSLLARVLILGIWAYRYSLSPLIGQQCRFLPTCSVYTAEAIAHHGARRGGWLGIKRICRCRPGGGAGYDPVPDKINTPTSP